MNNVLALSVSGLHASYPGHSDWVLRNVEFTLRAGECAALLGANGSGKSTLLQSIAGLLQPSSGKIQIEGRPISQSSSRVSYVAQLGTVDWSYPICVRCFVQMGRYVHTRWMRRLSSADRALAEEKLEQMGLAELGKRRIDELSGGQKQRVLLARALTQNASVLLLDEPFNGVDAVSRETFCRTIQQLRSEGRTLLIATHEPETIRKQLDTSFRLAEGVLTQVESAA